MAGSQDPDGLDAPDPHALGARPPAEAPRELAKRLAAEAMARRDAAKPAEDPRDLARRLAAEAMAKRETQAQKSGLASAAPPPGRVVAEVPAAPKKRRKKKKKAPSSETASPGLAGAVPPPEAAAAAPRPSLAARASQAPVMSAQEALAAALAAESSSPPAAATPTAKGPSKTKKRRRAAPEAPAATPAAAPAPPADQFDAGGVVISVFSGAEIRRTIEVTNREVFRALWFAHRARAVHEGDLGLVSTSSVLIDAADRLGDGCLSAVRVRLSDRDHAMWVDTSRGVLLGVASPPEIYLAGL
ncbi:MAG: hypothetical protein ACI8PZ_000656 [Myxococcota bacterium]|jgi:hypothetical protein